MIEKYTTLVFRSVNEDESEEIRGFARSELCRAWSMDHEIIRLELIEKALDEGDIEKAREYIGETDVTRLSGDLKQ